jgi:hypothetical protein
VQQQNLRSQYLLTVNGLVLPGALLIDDADSIPLGRGQVGLDAASLIGGESISERTGPGPPDPSLDAVLTCQRKVNRSRQIAAQTFIVCTGYRVVPTGRVEGIPITDQIAGASGQYLRAPNLCGVRLPVQLHQQDANRDAGGERKHPEQNQSRPQRVQVEAPFRSAARVC